MQTLSLTEIEEAHLAKHPTCQVCGENKAETVECLIPEHVMIYFYGGRVADENYYRSVCGECAE